MSSELVYDLADPRHRYLLHFEVPQFADYEPLRRILATPSKTRCRKSAPICILLGANEKLSAARKPCIFSCFRATPTRSGPKATLLHSVGGPSAACIFTVFPPRPHQKRPWSHHSAFCGESFRALTVPSRRVTTITSDGHPTNQKSPPIRKRRAPWRQA